jgi:hypothetical protein
VFAIEVQSRGEVGGEGDDSAGAFVRIVIGDFTETFVVRFPWGSGARPITVRAGGGRSKCLRAIRALCLA